MIVCGFFYKTDNLIKKNFSETSSINPDFGVIDIDTLKNFRRWRKISRKPI